MMFFHIKNGDWFSHKGEIFQKKGNKGVNKDGEFVRFYGADRVGSAAEPKKTRKKTAKKDILPPEDVVNEVEIDDEDENLLDDIF